MCQELLKWHASRKYGEYHKRLAKCQQQANALMVQLEIEIPTVNSLMACPLSKFIHFAANDCGYKGTRYGLIANWVHPLFLKTKSEVSKENNLTWKQAMNVPFKQEHWKTAMKELETLKGMDAGEAADRSKVENAIYSIGPSSSNVFLTEW